MKLSQLNNKKIIILGLGREGLSSLNFITSQIKKGKLKPTQLAIADKKNEDQFEDGIKNIIYKHNIKKYLGKNYLRQIYNYDIIIKTPGLALSGQTQKKIKQNKIQLTSNVNLFLSNRLGQVIGVTGSKGKGTTATLIYKILKAAGKKTYLVGNIGKPFLDYLKYDSKQTIYTAELSSFHLENILGKIDMGVITSFFPEHLSHHQTLSNYFQAKINLVRRIKKGGTIFYNSNYKRIKNFIRKQKIKAVAFNQPEIEIQTKLKGKHNLANINAAIKVAQKIKIPHKIILKSIKNFKGLPYRMEYIGEYKGRCFYCDTLGTTPEATIVAIQALNPETLIVGGSGKGASQQQFLKLARQIAQSKVLTLIAMPDEGYKIAKLLNQHKLTRITKIIKVQNMQRAVQSAFKQTRKGGVVLLSPAAASFDQYNNYSQKGEHFKKLIKQS